MIVIITDAHYRMAAALIRDMVEAEMKVIVCETADFEKPLGFFCRGITRTAVLPSEDSLQALFELCSNVYTASGEKPVLLPVGAKTLAALAEIRSRFDAVCGLLIPSKAHLELLNDKSAVHLLAERCGIPVPKDYYLAEGQSLTAFSESVPLPCVVKPLCGEKFGLAAKDRYCICRTPEQLENAYVHFSALTSQPPLIEQYLSGDGLGCSVLCENGEVLCAISHRRIREYPISGGPSSCCCTIHNHDLLPQVKLLVSELEFSGLAMFEFKLDANGTPHLLECNPRLWGTFPLTRASGSNFSRIWAMRAAGQPAPEYIRPKKVKMVYYPSDLLAGIGYLLHGKVGKFFGVLGDFLSIKTKHGLYERKDPAPYWRYVRSLFERGGNHAR